MTTSLEQELEQLIQSEDYRVHIWSGSDSINVRLIYLPKLVMKGEGAFRYVANGEIGQKWFRGRRKWTKAKKWIVREITGHRELVQQVHQA